MSVSRAHPIHGLAGQVEQLQFRIVGIHVVVDRSICSREHGVGRRCLYLEARPIGKRRVIAINLSSPVLRLRPEVQLLFQGRVDTRRGRERFEQGRRATFLRAHDDRANPIISAAHRAVPQTCFQSRAIA